MWVRQDPPVINVDNKPTEKVEPEGSRFAGCTWKYTTTDTEIAWDARYVDHGYEWYNVKMKPVFDRPPIVLNPPLRYKVTATASHSGTSQEPSPGSVLLQRHLRSLTLLSIRAWVYGPEHQGMDDQSPGRLSRGGHLQDIRRLVELRILQCDLDLQGGAGQCRHAPRRRGRAAHGDLPGPGSGAGRYFFPGDLPGQRPVKCSVNAQYRMEVKGGRAFWNCYEGGAEKLKLFVLDWNRLADYQEDVIVAFLAAVLIKHCGHYWENALGAARLNQAEAYSLKLALDQGAMHLNNVAGGLTTSVKTPLGTAVAAAKGGSWLPTTPPTTSPPSAPMRRR